MHNQKKGLKRRKKTTSEKKEKARGTPIREIGMPKRKNGFKKKNT